MCDKLNAVLVTVLTVLTSEHWEAFNSVEFLLLFALECIIIVMSQEDLFLRYCVI